MFAVSVAARIDPQLKDLTHKDEATLRSAHIMADRNDRS